MLKETHFTPRFLLENVSYENVLQLLPPNQAVPETFCSEAFKRIVSSN